MDTTTQVAPPCAPGRDAHEWTMTERPFGGADGRTRQAYGCRHCLTRKGESWYLTGGRPRTEYNAHYYDSAADMDARTEEPY